MSGKQAKRFCPADRDSQENFSLRPFLTVGVTTYNRHDLLKQTLSSITEQSFSDLEVIVGNDYPQEALSGEVLGIVDPRIRFVNNPQTLGELGNMNSLLRASRGRYFTWQFDDDLYASGFFQAVYDALVKFNFPPCVFTSYEIIRGHSFPHRGESLSGQVRIFSGRHFLRMYFQGLLKAMGCSGVFDAKYLKRIGGVERLCDGPIAIFSEYLLLIKAGLVENVAHIDVPLVLYRVHEESRGASNTDLRLWKCAGENLICKSIGALKSPKLQEDFHDNLLSILKLTFHKLVSKTLAARGFVQAREIYSYLFSLKQHIEPLRGSNLYWAALRSLGKAGIWLVWIIVVAKLTPKAPLALIRLALTTRSLLLRRRYFWQ